MLFTSVDIKLQFPNKSGIANGVATDCDRFNKNSYKKLTSTDKRGQA
jgi:hypothetical protein